MSEKNERVAAALDRLFRTYPQYDRGDDPLALALDRMERAKVYLEAVGPYELVDIEAGINNFITGSAPGVNPSFIPPAPAVASEVRRCMNVRIDSERMGWKPSLPRPDIQHAPESQARVGAMVDRLVNKLANDKRTEEARNDREWAKRQARVQARFDEPMTSDHARRLMGYEVGDLESERQAS